MPIAGQTARPNVFNFFGTLSGGLGLSYTKKNRNFFFNNFFSSFFFHWQRLALQLVKFKNIPHTEKISYIV